MSLSKFISANSIRGFLADDEGETLHRLAKEVAAIGPCLEVGSYCGKSTVYLGDACRETNNTLYAVDHHAGSEEHQVGEEYHDPDLYNDREQCFDSFPMFKRSLKLAQLTDWVVPIVSRSDVVVRHWATPLGLVFIDGGHSHEMALADCMSWSRKIAEGGVLAVHDIFPKPEEGGQGPYLALEAVFDAGGFERVAQVNSLGILRKIRDTY